MKEHGRLSAKEWKAHDAMLQAFEEFGITKREKINICAHFMARHIASLQPLQSHLTYNEIRSHIQDLACYYKRPGVCAEEKEPK